MYVHRLCISVGIITTFEVYTRERQCFNSDIVIVSTCIYSTCFRRKIWRAFGGN